MVMPPIKRPNETSAERDPITGAIIGQSLTPPVQQPAKLDPIHTDIHFNADGSVDMTKGGVTTNLSKEQYSDLLKVQRGGSVSYDPKVQQAALTPQQTIGQQLASQVGVVNETPAPTIQPASYGDIAGEIATKVGIGAAGAAGAAGVTSALGGGAAGGAGLAAVANPVGATIAAGAILLTANSIIGQLKEERKQQTTVEKKGYADGITKIKSAITYAKAGGDSELALALYNRGVQDVYQAESNLKLLDESMWTKAKDELVAIETFKQTKFLLDTQMIQALQQNPNANYDFPIELNTSILETNE